MKQVLSLFLTSFMTPILRHHRDDTFGCEFFASELWPQGPNSTQRLSLANFQALRRAEENCAGQFKLNHVVASRLDDRLKQHIASADMVLVHSVASTNSRALINALVNWARSTGWDALPPMVFGSEVDWFAQLVKGGVALDDVCAMYREAMFIRHTPYVDTPIYMAASPLIHCARIQEFPLGIDVEVVRGSNVAQTDKSLILFVRAPEGRRLKDNAAIAELRQTVEGDTVLAKAGFQVHELAPPYTTLEYWALLDHCAALIMTSRTETFSYVMNDARAKGVPAFYPMQMYRSTVGNRLALESYPWSTGKFSSSAMLLAEIKQMLLDSPRYMQSKEAARQKVAQHFSLQALANDWQDLILDRPLNHEALLLVMGRVTFNSLVKQCRQHRCRYVLLVDADFSHLGLPRKLTHYLADEDICLVNSFRMMDLPAESKVFDTAAISNEIEARHATSVSADHPGAHGTRADRRRFLQMLVRSYRIGQVVHAGNLPAEWVEDIAALVLAAGSGPVASSSGSAPEDNRRLKIVSAKSIDP